MHTAYLVTTLAFAFMVAFSGVGKITFRPPARSDSDVGGRGEASDSKWAHSAGPGALWSRA